MTRNHVILVSALGPNPSFSFFGGLLFNLGACWDRGPELDLDQGLTIKKVSLLFQYLLITFNIKHLPTCRFTLKLGS